MTLLGNWQNLYLGLEDTELVLENRILPGWMVLLGVSDGNPDNDNRNPPATTIIQGCVATSSYLWNDLGCLSRRHMSVG